MHILVYSVFNISILILESNEFILTIFYKFRFSSGNINSTKSLWLNAETSVCYSIVGFLPSKFNLEHL